MTTIDHREKEVPSVDKGAGDVPDFEEANEHPRLRIPFSVTIDGRAYEGVTLSMVGARIAGIAAANWAGAAKLAIFRFNFKEFWLSLPIDVTVASSDSETGAMILRFRDPTGQHMPQIRYLLNSWLAGDQITLNGLLGTPGAGQGEATSTPKGALQPGNAVLAKVAGTLGISLATIGLIAFIASGLSNRLFVTDVDGPAVVQRQGLTMKATTSGQIDFINLNAAAGQPVYSILSSNGVSLTASMPCDCDVIPAGIERGSTVLLGQPILDANRRDAPLIVQSTLTGPELRRLGGGATAEIETPGGSRIEAKVVLDRTATGPGGPLPVTLLPIRPLDATPGTPVVVRLDNSPELLRSMKAGLSYLWGSK
jgi:hypothetical protein